MVLYHHRRKSDNTIFYIGIGTIKRANAKTGRNKLWHRIAKKHGIYVEILIDNLSKTDAIKWEIYLIELYGKINDNNGPLCNITNGGDGASGVTFILSDETKKKMSIASKGKPKSIQHRINIGNGHRGINNYMYGKKHTYETKNKMSESHKGIKNHFYGKTHSEKTRQHISQLNKGRTGDKCQNSKKVIDIVSGKTYSCCKDAAEYLSIKYSTLRAKLNGSRPNNTNLKYI